MNHHEKEKEQHAGNDEKPEHIITKDERCPNEDFNESNDFSSLMMDGGSGGDEDNVFKETVCNEMSGLGLLSTLAVSTLMAIASVITIYNYEYRKTESSVGRNSTMDCFMASSQMLDPWADLLYSQVDVLQNLVHAALLGGAGIVVAFRGDLVWLAFCRNCAFYFGLAACSYTAVALHPKQKLSAGSGDDWLIYYVAPFAGFCFVTFVKAEWTRQKLYRLQSNAVSGSGNLPLSSYPDTIAKTEDQYTWAKKLSRLAVAVQFVDIVYTFQTTQSAWAHLSPGACDEETLSLGHEDPDYFGSFVKSYTLGAHQSFLLSLIYIGSLAPTCPASVGGTILSSTWRSILATSFLAQIIMRDSIGEWDSRTLLSLAYTLTELSLQLACMICGLRLHSLLPSQRRMRQSSAKSDSYDYVVVDSNDEQDVTEDDEKVTDCVSLTLPPGPLTVYKIGTSGRFSSEQRQGGSIWWVGSAMLLSEMTLECILLMSQSTMVTHFSSNVLKWGMHVSAIYLFCNVMCVSYPEVYGRSRVLLLIASPTGSLVGIWQLWSLIQLTSSWNAAAVVTGVLFVLRIASGVCQTVGLCLVKHTRPMDESNCSPILVPAKSFGTLLRNGRRALYFCYLPSLIALVWWVGFQGNCDSPMIPDRSSEDAYCEENGFHLAKNWVGVGFFFHFGILLLLFSNDGMNRSPSYPPSLSIGYIFTLHVTILIWSSALWQLIPSRQFNNEGNDTYVNRHGGSSVANILFLLWGVASTALLTYLHRLVKFLT